MAMSTPSRVTPVSYHSRTDLKHARWPSFLASEPPTSPRTTTPSSDSYYCVLLKPHSTQCSSCRELFSRPSRVTHSNSPIQSIPHNPLPGRARLPNRRPPTSQLPLHPKPLGITLSPAKSTKIPETPPPHQPRPSGVAATLRTHPLINALQIKRRADAQTSTPITSSGDVALADGCRDCCGYCGTATVLTVRVGKRVCCALICGGAVAPEGGPGRRGGVFCLRSRGGCAELGCVVEASSGDGILSLLGVILSVGHVYSPSSALIGVLSWQGTTARKFHGSCTPSLPHLLQIFLQTTRPIARSGLLTSRSGPTTRSGVLSWSGFGCDAEHGRTK